MLRALKPRQIFNLALLSFSEIGREEAHIQRRPRKQENVQPATFPFSSSFVPKVLHCSVLQTPQSCLLGTSATSKKQDN